MVLKAKILNKGVPSLWFLEKLALSWDRSSLRMMVFNHHCLFYFSWLDQQAQIARNAANPGWWPTYLMNFSSQTSPRDLTVRNLSQKVGGNLRAKPARSVSLHVCPVLGFFTTTSWKELWLYSIFWHIFRERSYGGLMAGARIHGMTGWRIQRGSWK